MLLKYSNSFLDVKFALEKLFKDLKTESISDSIVLEIEGKEPISGLDNILSFLGVYGKYTIKDVTKVRAFLEKVEIDNSFVSYISLYKFIASLRTKPDLKNIAYIEEMVNKYDCRYLLLNLLEIRVGKFLEIADVEGSDNLYVEQVDFGTHRQIVSGLRKHHDKEFLVNKKSLFITNIKKSKIKGQESNGMILCGKDSNQLEVLFVDDSIEIGTVASLSQSDVFGELPIGTIDLKKKFYSDLFANLKIKDGFLCFEDEKVKLGKSYVESKLKQGNVC